MQISRIQINNFRSIKHLDMELPQICALVGPNNAGKSNLLLAIQRVLGRDWVSANSFSLDDVFGREPDNEIEISLTFDPPLQYRKYVAADPVEINALSFEYTRYKRGPQLGQPRLEQKSYDLNGKTPSVLAKAPKKGEPHKYQQLIGIPPEIRASIPIIYIGTNRSLKEHLPSARYSLLRPLLEDINRDLQNPEQIVEIKQPDGSSVNEQRSERFHKLMKHAMELLRTPAFEDLELSIKRNALSQLGFDPDTDTDKLDFFFSPFDTMDFYKSLDLRIREGDFEISATQLGEGIQNALVLSILKAFEERRKQGAIILIEEPEMFLHPQMQRSLYKTIREIGETNQVIYTTHSPHFVTIPEYQEVLLIRKDLEGTSATHSDLDTNLRRHEKMLKELDPERNELFFANRLLLVEGDTEKLALPEYARRLGFDLDREGASIVEVGGKQSILEFARIAASFGITTAILFDSDCSDLSKDENDELNTELFTFKTSDHCEVWMIEGNYEANLRETIGEPKYVELCQKYPKMGKPTRARLIAAQEVDLPIPAPIEEVLLWLANKNVK